MFPFTLISMSQVALVRAQLTRIQRRPPPPLLVYPPALLRRSLFVDTLPHDAECPMCKHIMTDMLQCTNGHSYCSSCIKIWKVSNGNAAKCPACQVSLNVLVPNRVMESAVAETKVHCFTRIDADGEVLGDEMEVENGVACNGAQPVAAALELQPAPTRASEPTLAAKADILRRPLTVGDKVDYFSGIAPALDVTVVAVHRDDPPSVYYTIRGHLDGADAAEYEKQTTCNHLGRKAFGTGDPRATVKSATAPKPRPARCDWQGKLEDATSHFKVCAFAGIPCPFDGCEINGHRTIVARRDFEAHEARCPHKLVPCTSPGCGAMVKRAAMSDHDRRCPKRLVGCPHACCDAEWMCADLLADHLKICLYEEVVCTYACLGCDKRMLRKDLEAHEKEAGWEHNRMLLAAVSNQQEMRLFDREHTLQITLKHDVVMGNQPFVPSTAGLPDYIYSTNSSTIDGRTFTLYLRQPSARNGSFGLYLLMSKGRLPCVVQAAFNSNGQAAKVMRLTFETHNLLLGDPTAVFWATLRSAVGNPFVRDGDVTFNCAFEVLH